MILQRLPRFLAEINAKLLIKYDGERRTKKYTIRFLLKDIKLKSGLGNSIANRQIGRASCRERVFGLV